MNKIYKVIWSKVKHQYVVVSELAHSCTKSTSSRVGRSTAAVFTAFMLTMGTGIAQAAPVQEEPLYPWMLVDSSSRNGNEDVTAATPAETPETTEPSDEQGSEDDMESIYQNAGTVHNTQGFC